MKIDNRTLEFFLLNELPTQQMDTIKRQLQTDPELKKRVKQLKDSNEAIIEAFPPQQIVPQIKANLHLEETKARRETEQRSRPLWVKRLFFASPALAAAAVIFFLVFPMNTGIINQTPFHQSPDITRSKGDKITKPLLLVYRQTQKEIQLLKQGSTAISGDLLQLAYKLPKALHGVILSIDGNGAVTRHFPAEAGNPTRMEVQKEIRLSNAYELDDAPGFERFFLITSTKPIAVQLVMKQATQLAKNHDKAQKEDIHFNDAKSLKQISFLIVKGAKK